jgi:t-SNARE complex subunit (syntaxin)
MDTNHVKLREDFDRDYKVLDKYLTELNRFRELFQNSVVDRESQHYYDSFFKQSDVFKNNFRNLFKLYVFNIINKPHNTQNSDIELIKNCVMYFKDKLTKKYDDYNDCMSKFKTYTNDMKKRHLKIIFRDQITDEQADKIDYSQIQNIYMSHGNKQVLIELLQSIENRHTEIMKLEESLNELAQLFQDFAILVQSQQKSLDLIEHHVDNAVMDVENGVKNLDKALDHQKSSRKKMCCILGLVFVLLGILLVVILVPLSKFIKFD